MVCENNSNVSTVLETTNTNVLDISNIFSTKKKQLQNCISTKLDVSIDQTEFFKNKLELLESHNKTKGIEVENEYNFLKQVGDVCKRSCRYYLETNISFHESCENFNILFKIFSESLSRLEEKSKDAEAIEEILKDIEQKETTRMIQKKEINEQQKIQLEFIEKELQFMNNDSKNITNKIKEIVYQINQHKEAFESFFILTNMNYEKNAILENDLSKLKEEQEDVTNYIIETNKKKTECCEHMKTEKENLETQRLELIQRGKELKEEKEHMAIKKSELLSNISILESQTKFLENQITSQEYYLNVIMSGYEGNIKRKDELEKSIDCIKSDIENIKKKIDAAKIEQNKKMEEQEQIQNDLKNLEINLQEKREELKLVKDEENKTKTTLLQEQKNVDVSMIANLTKEMSCIEEKIDNYKEEIKVLLIEEQKKVNLLKDVTVECEDSKSLIKNLEKVLETYKMQIKEEQEKQWANERAIKKVQLKIKNLEEKVIEEKQKIQEIDEMINTRVVELEKMKKTNAETEELLTSIKNEKVQIETKYNIQNEELKKIESKLDEMNKKVECTINELHTEYEEKTKKFYEGKMIKMDLESTEKQQIKEESRKYLQNLIEEYELKKKAFKEEATKTFEENNKQIEEDLKKKDELIEYYKELLSKLKKKEQSSGTEDLKRSNNTKKISTTQNLKTKKNDVNKIYQKRNSGNKMENGATHAFDDKTIIHVDKEDLIHTTNEDKEHNAYSDSVDRVNKHNMSGTYQFGYFDRISADAIRKNMQTQNRTIKSPHITRLLTKINSRKKCETQGGVKKLTSFQFGKNNKNFYKIKPTKNTTSFDLFQTSQASQNEHKCRHDNICVLP